MNSLRRLFFIICRNLIALVEWRSTHALCCISHDAPFDEQLLLVGRDFCGYNQLVSITFRIQINRKHLTKNAFRIRLACGPFNYIIILLQADRFRLLNYFRNFDTLICSVFCAQCLPQLQLIVVNVLTLSLAYAIRHAIGIQLEAI